MHGAYDMKQNITICIDKTLFKKSKIIAAQRETSVSTMLKDELERLVQSTEQYELAKREALTNLEKGFHFGGKITVSREALYER